jgi:hypothetical protein
MLFLSHFGKSAKIVDSVLQKTALLFPAKMIQAGKQGRYLFVSCAHCVALP